MSAGEIMSRQPMMLFEPILAVISRHSSSRAKWSCVTAFDTKKRTLILMIGGCARNQMREYLGPLSGPRDYN